MILTNKEILNYVKTYNLIEKFNPSNLAPIGYDLTTGRFEDDLNTEGGAWYNRDYFDLPPKRTILIRSREVIHFPTFMIGMVHPRDAYVRLGLIIQSPLYQPGLNTNIVYSVFNSSDSSILLEKGVSYAMLTFARIKNTEAYSGKYANDIAQDDTLELTVSSTSNSSMKYSSFDESFGNLLK